MTNDNIPACCNCNRTMTKVVRMDYKKNDVRILIYMCKECVLWGVQGAKFPDAMVDRGNDAPVFRNYSQVLQHPHFKNNKRKWFFSENALSECFRLYP